MVPHLSTAEVSINASFQWVSIPEPAVRGDRKIVKCGYFIDSGDNAHDGVVSFYLFFIKNAARLEE